MSINYVKESNHIIIPPNVYQKIFITGTGYVVTPHHVFNQSTTIIKPGCCVEKAPRRVENVVKELRNTEFDIILRRCISQTKRGNAMFIQPLNPDNYCYVPIKNVDMFFKKGVVFKTGVFATSFVKIEDKNTGALLCYTPRIHLQSIKVA